MPPSIHGVMDGDLGNPSMGPTATSQSTAVSTAAPAATLGKRLSGVQIKAGGGDFCLQPVDPDYCPESDIQVVTLPCAEAVYTWDINPGSGSITLTDYPDLALDAGEQPQNGGQVKVGTVLATTKVSAH